MNREEGLELEARWRPETVRLLLVGAEVLLLALLCVWLVWMFRRDTVREVELSAVVEAMEQDCDLEGLTRGDANTLKRCFGLDGADYAFYLIYTSESTMDVEELLIVRGPEEQLDRLEAAVQSRLERQKQSFDGYGTNQEALLEDAILWERGGYFFYGVSEQAEQWEEAFLSCIR